MTSIFNRRSFIAFVAAAMLFASLPAFAADPAADFVQRMGNKALSSLTAKEIPAKEREARVRDLLRNNFDVQTIAKFALGTYWKSASEAQKSEYMSLFEDMIVKTYSQRFSEYSGQSFKVGSSTKSGEKDTLVESHIVQQGGPPVSVEWRVRNKGGSFKVVDVIVEDISMSVTQRSDFSSVIQSGGGKVDALLNSLRKRKNGK